MIEEMIGFTIWVLVGVFFIGMGVYSFKAKKAVGFWANAEMYEVVDVKAYNTAMGKLWIVFGFVFILLGIPLLSEQNSPLIFISIVGSLIEIIAIMIIYTLVITPKFRKR